MILKEELLQKYKQYLINLDYPFIKQKSEADIQKLFEKDNRSLLLSWMIKKYLPTFNDKIQEAQNDDKIEGLLINIIYDNGFCRLDEKDLFVKGTLQDEKQIVIFNKIFHMLSLIYASDLKEEIGTTEENNKLKQMFTKPTEELKNEIIPDTNLLKTLGLITKMPDEERKNKFDSYKKEIDNLKNILETEEKKEKLFINKNISNITLNDIEKLVTDFKTHMSESNFDDFVDFTNNKTGEASRSNKTELENLVSVNSKEIISLMQTLQKKKDLNGLVSENNTEIDLDATWEEDFSSSVLHNFVLSNKIIEEAGRTAEN